jgi:hypothetical protein
MFLIAKFAEIDCVKLFVAVNNRVLAVFIESACLSSLNMPPDLAAIVLVVNNCVTNLPNVVILVEIEVRFSD